MIIQIIADSPISDINRVDRSLPIIALDGAIYRLLEAGITPGYLIGDMDVACKAMLAEARTLGVEVIHEMDQNTNDLEKGITLAERLQATEIRVFQAVGGRMDHTFHNLGLLKKFYPRQISMINEDEIITYLENTHFTLHGAPLLPIAIMGFPTAIVTSKGLAYDMQNFHIQIGGRQSSSNALALGTAKVEVEGGVVLIRDCAVSIIF